MSIFKLTAEGLPPKPTPTNPRYKAAKAYIDAKISIIPIPIFQRESKWDGKTPDLKWTPYMDRVATNEEIKEWFSDDAPMKGIATICGKVSGNMELIDFDANCEKIFPEWKETVDSMLSDVFSRCHITKSPRGYHVRYRCPDLVIPGNDKLAMNADGKECLIETRGEGGYALAPGTPSECHRMGIDYHDISDRPLHEILKGTITAEERAVLIDTAKSYDQSVHEAEPEPEPDPEPEEHIAENVSHQNGNAASHSIWNQTAQGSTTPDRLRPGDDFNARASWADVLEPFGWKMVGRRPDGALLWRRPGKDSGSSATTGYCKGELTGDLLHIFSSNAAPFESRKSYSKFAAYATLKHKGDFSAATADLGRTYGEKARKPDNTNTTDNKNEVKIYNLVELLALQIPEQKWAVPGILSEGMTLLAGAPKQGKSWLALNLAITIAFGGHALGNIKVDPGDVLYLSLEDRLRRVQYRAKKIITGLGGEISERLFIAIQWPRQQAGGIEEIKKWAASMERPVLFIVDVWQKWKPISEKKRSTNQYEEDYQFSTELKDATDAIGCSSLIIHHTKKGKSEDFIEDVSGTLGLAGAADGVLVLRRSRGSEEAVLHMTGRDIDEKELALTFNQETAVWSTTGTHEERIRSKCKLAILEVFKKNPTGRYTSAEMAKAIDMDVKTTRTNLWRLVDVDKILENENSKFLMATPKPEV